MPVELLYDLKTLLPVVVSFLQGIPIARIRHSSKEVDYLLDNILISTDNLLPNKVRVETVTEIAMNSDIEHAVPPAPTVTVVTIFLSDIQLKMRGVKFWYRRKTGLVRMYDHGLVDLETKRDGLQVTIQLSFDNVDPARTFLVRNVACKIAKLDVGLHDTEHEFG